VDRAAPPQAKRATHAKHAKRDVHFEDSSSDSSDSDASVGYESDGGYVTDKIHYARRGKDDSGRVTTDNIISGSRNSRTGCT
jgi:hypothetical protein